MQLKTPPTPLTVGIMYKTGWELCAQRAMFSTKGHPGSWIFQPQIHKSVQISSNLSTHSERRQKGTFQGSAWHLPYPLSETGHQPSGTGGMPHATAIITSCCESGSSGFDHLHLLALLPAKNYPSLPQLALSVCACLHCFSTTSSSWTWNDCQQLQSAGSASKGEPLEEAWEEAMGESSSRRPKLVEHDLCHNSPRGSCKSCLQVLCYSRMKER